MNCLKCGRETEEGQVFCKECREVMARYPVKPATAVLLPRRKEAAAPKKPKWRATPTLEDQLNHVRKQNRGLIIALCVVSLVLTVTLCVGLRVLFEKKPFRPGQNYSSMTMPPAPGDPVMVP